MNFHTMYPDTGSEQTEGKKPFCRCLKRFELLVPEVKYNVIDNNIHRLETTLERELYTNERLLTTPEKNFVW